LIVPRYDWTTQTEAQRCEARPQRGTAGHHRPRRRAGHAPEKEARQLAPPTAVLSGTDHAELAALQWGMSVNPKCPACGSPIQYQTESRPGAVYRCNACRLDLVVQPTSPTNKPTVWPLRDA